MEEFKYEIGGKSFYQKPIVLGQVKQLVNAIRGMAIPLSLNAVSLVLSLGDKMPELVSIVLIEEGVSLKDKKIDDVREWVEEYMSVEQAIIIVENFFDCNPITSISEALMGLAGKVEKTMKKATQKDPPSNLSTESVSSLPEETSPNETTSSGDTQ